MILVNVDKAAHGSEGCGQSGSLILRTDESIEQILEASAIYVIPLPSKEHRSQELS